MRRGKWLILLVLLTVIVSLTGCGGSDEKAPAPGTEQTQDNQVKEEPKSEAPKVEEPKVEAPTAEAPKVEPPKAEAPKPVEPKAEAPKVEPKAEAPKTVTKSTLNLGHDLSASYSNCKMCHSGKAMLSRQPVHSIDANTADCTTCHILKPKA